MKSDGTSTMVQGSVALIGINGVINMLVFGIQKWLAFLPEGTKFFMFWFGAILLALSVSFLVFRVIFKKKKEKAILIASVAGLSLVIMVLASPWLPLFFPINPYEAGLAPLEGCGCGLDDGWVVIPALLGVVALIGSYVYVRRKK